MRTSEAARYRWIATQILPFEGEVRGWLKAHLRSLSASDVDDVIQEAYARIWAAEPESVRHGRAYFYATVRNLLAERARRHRIVPIERLGEIEALRIISEEPGPERRASARQELERLRQKVAVLPPQCRRVFEMRCFQDLSQREIAQRLGIAEKTVENHLTRALAALNEAMGNEVVRRDPGVRPSTAVRRDDAVRDED